MKEKILVTGCAGFVGFHVCKQLLKKGLFVIGLDNLNDYNDVCLKKARLKELEKERKDRSAPDAASGIKPGGNILPNEGDSKNKMSPISGKSKGK